MRLRFGDCVLDTDSRALVRGNQQVHLTPKAFQLLTILVDARPRAVARQELQETLWPDTFVSDNLPGLINELRSGIGDSARGARYIKTLHGFGYSFAAEMADDVDKTTDSILVLPFLNTANDPELEYLCDGITESLLNAFSRVPQFRVIARSTAFRFKGSAEEPEAVAKQLGADIVITGRIAGTQDHLTIQLEAVDIRSESQIWGEKFRPLRNNVLAVEEEIAREIARALQLRLSAKDQGRMVQRHTSNPRAHDLYLRGRFHWNKRTGKWLQTAIQFFEESIAADPDYALPHAGLADAFVAIGSRDLIAPRDAFTRALASAARALELDPLLAEAQTSMAAIKEVHLWEWEEAGHRFGRAIELNPSYATAYQWYALHFARQQMFERAEEQMVRALEIDPLSAIILTNCALIAYLGRDYDLAASRAERALEIEPDNEGGHLVLAVALLLHGDHDAAINVHRSALARPHQTHTIAALGNALARAGQRAEALEILERLRALRREQYVSWVDFALVSVGLGLNDEAIESLESAMQDKSGWLIYLATDSRMDSLRGDPRFEAMVTAIGPRR